MVDKCTVKDHIQRSMSKRRKSLTKGEVGMLFEFPFRAEEGGGLTKLFNDFLFLAIELWTWSLSGLLRVYFKWFTEIYFLYILVKENVEEVYNK